MRMTVLDRQDEAVHEAGRAAAWSALRAAGGRRFEAVARFRHVLMAAGLGAVVLAVLALVLPAAARPHVVATAAIAALAAVVTDLEYDIVVRRPAGARFALRFAELYEAGERRPLSIEEENELWAIAARRLHLCSVQRVLAFEHGRRPADDAFLASAYRYLTGTPLAGAPLALGTRRAS